MAEPLSLLLVCLGNICRSPMAEGALRAHLARAGLSERVRVDSAGTDHGHIGQPPDRRAIATAARHGIDISGLRARLVRRGDFDAFDCILCADRGNLRTVRALAPNDAPAKIALYMEWAGLDGVIADPWMGDARDFDTVWRQVDRAAETVASRLRADAGAG